jgi:hypothetical protein
VIARPAGVGSWVDTSTPIPSALALDLVVQRIVGVIRYVPLPSNDSRMDISSPELARLTLSGLQVLLVQHVRFPPWHPVSCDGYYDGTVARNAALAAEYPSGCHLYCDLEGVGGFAGDTRRYLGEWASAVRVGGYLPALYVGYECSLSADGLYALPGFSSYWSDAGHRVVSTRGVAISQRGERVISGIKFDGDDVAPDLLGELPMACSHTTNDAVTGITPTVPSAA